MADAGSVYGSVCGCLYQVQKEPAEEAHLCRESEIDKKKSLADAHK